MIEFEKLPFIADTYGREIYPATIFYIFGYNNISDYYFELKLLFNSNVSEIVLIHKDFEKIDLKKIVHLLEKNIVLKKSPKHKKVYYKEVFSLEDISIETDKVKNIFDKIEFADFYDR